MRMQLLAIALGALTGLIAHETANAAPKVAVMSATPWAIAPGATWTWAPITTTSADPRVANDIMQDRLTDAVELSLVNHGLRQVSSPAAARYIVTYHVRLENRVEPKVSQGYGRACGIRGCISGWGPATVDLARYTEGVLVIDILDAHTGKLVWRAASEKKVSQKDASPAKINKMVADMTKTLPSA